MLFYDKVYVCRIIMTWFKSWFDSPYYRLLYEHRSDWEAERFLQNLLNKEIIPPESEILDVGCGYGRHACWLAQQNFTVMGIDLSPERIAEATAKAQKLTHPPKFWVQDMREINYHNQFDVVLNLFTSFGYFSDIIENQNVLSKFHKALKPTGTLILDYLNANTVSEEPEPVQKQINGVLFTIQKKRYSTYVEKKISIQDANQESHEFTEKVTLFEADKLTDMLLNAGFQNISKYGDYELNDWAANSPRSIMVARNR